MEGATAAAAASSAAAAPAPAAVVACQVPLRRFTPDGKVTSVDLTADGAYVVAGCSDGTIRLYSMADAGWGCEGVILGQIHAKGLITNLIFHVEVRLRTRPTALHACLLACSTRLNQPHGPRR